MNDEQNDFSEEELTPEEIAEFSGALTDTMFEENHPNLPDALMVDSVLRAETKEDAALALSELIKHLCRRRPRSEQASICLAMQLQALSHTRYVLAAFAELGRGLEAEVSRRKGQRMKPREPIPRGFVENAWYENLIHIMRTRPEAFRVFSPQTKLALSIYLLMKERHEQQVKKAA